MKVVVATVSSTLMRCSRASLLASPTLVPASTDPCRVIAPVRARMASRSVVFPLWKGPTRAMQRGPLGPPTLSPILFSVVSSSAPAWVRAIVPVAAPLGKGVRGRIDPWSSRSAGGRSHQGSGEATDATPAGVRNPRFPTLPPTARRARPVVRFNARTAVGGRRCRRRGSNRPDPEPKPAEAQPCCRSRPRAHSRPDRR